MSLPLVVKLGGDALASPERIAAEAERIARLAAAGPVVAVASARRGVTDQLLGLVQEVDSAARRLGDSAVIQPPGSSAEQDRVVASGEVVAASLLALALNRLGVHAVSLDAREAGVTAIGRFGGARINRVNPRRISQLLARGIVPVVTGFQGWCRGRVATLQRGGTDTSAIALAAALGGDRVLFVKDAEGLRTADPKLVPESRPIPRAPHHFLTALSAAGARIVQAEAAALAERERVTLEFCSLGSATPLSIVAAGAEAPGLIAVALAHTGDGGAAVTVVAADGRDLKYAPDDWVAALAADAVAVRGQQLVTHGVRLVLPEGQATSALRTLHRWLIEDCTAPSPGVRRAS